MARRPDRPTLTRHAANRRPPPRPAACLLHSLAPPIRQRLHIHPPDPARQAQFPSCIDHKPSVASRIHSPKAVVDMQDTQFQAVPRTKSEQGAQQHHGIPAAADPKQPPSPPAPRKDAVDTCRHRRLNRLTRRHPLPNLDFCVIPATTPTNIPSDPPYTPHGCKRSPPSVAHPGAFWHLNDSISAMNMNTHLQTHPPRAAWLILLLSWQATLAPAAEDPAPVLPIPVAFPQCGAAGPAAPRLAGATPRIALPSGPPTQPPSGCPKHRLWNRARPPPGSSRPSPDWGGTSQGVHVGESPTPFIRGSLPGSPLRTQDPRRPPAGLLPAAPASAAWSLAPRWGDDARDAERGDAFPGCCGSACLSR